MLAVSVVMLLAVGLCTRVPWSRLPAGATTAFPLLMPAGLGAIGRVDDGQAASYAALIVLAFVFLGLTQRPGASVLFAVPATAAGRRSPTSSPP